MPADQRKCSIGCPLTLAIQDRSVLTEIASVGMDRLPSHGAPQPPQRVRLAMWVVLVGHIDKDSIPRPRAFGSTLRLLDSNEICQHVAQQEGE